MVTFRSSALTDLSGGDRHGQKLRGSDFFRNRLAVGNQTGDVRLDGLGCPLPTLLDRLPVGEAPGQGRDRDHQIPVLIRFDDDGVAAHDLILSQRGSELVGGEARLGQDGPEQTRTNCLSGVDRDGDAAATVWVLQLDVRALLRHGDPSQPTERLDDFTAGDTRKRGHPQPAEAPEASASPRMSFPRISAASRSLAGMTCP